MRIVLGIGVVAITIACVVVLTRPAPAEPTLHEPAPVAAPAAPVAAPAVPVAAPAASVAAHGADQTVALQVQLIDTGTLDAWRATFVPELRAQVTADALAACRTRIHQVPVRPDWEMAEHGVDEHGLRVRKVSMFGKSMTGFHEQRDGRWLADALWCLPVGLP